MHLVQREVLLSTQSAAASQAAGHGNVQVCGISVSSVSTTTPTNSAATTRAATTATPLRRGSAYPARNEVATAPADNSRGRHDREDSKHGLLLSNSA